LGRWGVKAWLEVCGNAGDGGRRRFDGAYGPEAGRPTDGGMPEKRVSRSAAPGVFMKATLRRGVEGRFRGRLTGG